MERSIVRIPVYIAFGFAVFLVALVLTFPDQRLKEIATVQIEKQLGGKYDVTIEDLDLWWLSGVQLKNVKISERITDPNAGDAAAEGPKDAKAKGGAAGGMPEKEPFFISIPRVAAGFSPVLSLLNFAPTADFLVDLGGGDISGNFAQSSKNRTLKIDINEIELAKTPILEQYLGVPIRGELGGNIELNLHPRQPQVVGGDIKLKGNGLTVEKSELHTDKLGPMAFIDVPETDFGELDAHMTISQGEDKSKSRMNFDEFSFHDGEDVRGQIWGHLDLGRSTTQSIAKIEMRFQFDDKYIRSNDLSSVLNMQWFREGKNQDWFGFLLWGRLSKPRFKGAPTAATGPQESANADEDAGAADAPEAPE